MTGRCLSRYDREGSCDQTDGAANFSQLRAWLAVQRKTGQDGIRNSFPLTGQALVEDTLE